MTYHRLVEKIIKEQSDQPMGLEPLVQEFASISTLTPEQREDRTKKIETYYSAIYNRSNSLKQAYNITRNWCLKIFVAPYVKRTLDQYGSK